MDHLFANGVLWVLAEATLLALAFWMPISLIAKRGSRVIFIGVFIVWFCGFVSLCIEQRLGEDPDLAIGGMLFFGWIPGLLYCLFIYAIRSALKPHSGQQSWDSRRS